MAWNTASGWRRWMVKGPASTGITCRREIVWTKSSYVRRLSYSSSSGLQLVHARDAGRHTLGNRRFAVLNAVLGAALSSCAGSSCGPATRSGNRAA